MEISEVQCQEAYPGLDLGLRRTGRGTAGEAEESIPGEAVQPLHVGVEAVRHLIDAVKAALQLQGDTVGEPPSLLCPNLPPQLFPSIKIIGKLSSSFSFFYCISCNCVNNVVLVKSIYFSYGNYTGIIC